MGAVTASVTEKDCTTVLLIGCEADQIWVMTCHHFRIFTVISQNCLFGREKSDGDTKFQLFSQTSVCLTFQNTRKHWRHLKRKGYGRSDGQKLSKLQMTLQDDIFSGVRFCTVRLELFHLMCSFNFS